MIDNALTNPPVPDWNALSNEDREGILREWEFHSCPHSCGGDAAAFYEEIRKVLLDRERRIFRATMAGPSI